MSTPHENLSAKLLVAHHTKKGMAGNREMEILGPAPLAVGLHISW